MGNLQEKSFHTKKSVSRNQYSTFGEIKFITREKNGLDIEKTLNAAIKPDMGGASDGLDVPDSPTQLVMQFEEKEKESLKKTKNTSNPLAADAGKSLVIEAFMDVKTSMVDELSTIFDKKLEKLDNAVIELIDCKTENERLKGKIDNLIKENYKLKKELLSYKPFVPGVYIKSRKNEFSL